MLWERDRVQVPLKVAELCYCLVFRNNAEYSII